LGDYQHIAITEKHPALPPTVRGGKSNIFHDDFIGLYAESLPSVCSAESALVAGAPHGYLQQNAVRLAGRPDDVALIVHKFFPDYSSLENPFPVYQTWLFTGFFRE